MITFSKLGLKGKFGNQMFQYATLFALALEKNYDFGINFDINRTYQIKGDSERFHIYLQDAFNLSCKKIDNFNFIQKFWQEPSNFEFDKSIYNIKDNTNIEGYFQNEMYFKKYRSLLLKEFDFKKEIKEEAKKQLEPYKDFIKISLHVRRGDYLRFEKWHPVQKIGYFISALSNFHSDLQKVLVFSDDVEWCQKYFLPNRFKVIKGNNKYVDMCMMSMCHHNIISNSSFSWWGAWLNNNLGKKVIAPKEWFGPKYSHIHSENIVPKNWVKI